MSTMSLSGARIDGSRWLLLGSLALNLFFIGLGASVYIRDQAPLDRSPAGRIERLAAVLPSADADILRRTFQSQRAEFDAGRGKYDASREAIRAAMRSQPFDAAALRASMAETRAVRQSADQMFQNVIVTAASAMSQAGRNRLADYQPPGTPPTR